MTPESQIYLPSEEKELTYDQKIEDLLKEDQKYQQEQLQKLKTKQISPEDFFSSLSERTIKFRQKLGEVHESGKQMQSKMHEQPLLTNENLLNTLGEIRGN